MADVGAASVLPNELVPATYLNNANPFLRLQTQLTYSSSSMKHKAAEQQLCPGRPRLYGTERAERLWRQVKP